MKRDKLIAWLNENKIIIIMNILLIIHLTYNNNFSKILYIIVVSILIFIRAVQFNKYFKHNMKKLRNDTNIDYEDEQLRKDSRFFYVFTYSSYLFCLILFICFLFLEQYTLLIFIFAVIIIIIGVLIDNRFEKRSKLREILAEKDKA